MPTRSRWTLAASMLALGLAFTLAGGAAQAQALTEGYVLVDTWVTTVPNADVPVFERPAGIDVASDDSIYVVDSQAEKVYHLSSVGRVIESWDARGIGRPEDVVASASRVYVLGNTGGRIYDRDGSNPRNWNAAGAGVAFGPNQRVYVARMESGVAVIAVYDVDGNRLATWKDESFPVLSAYGLDVSRTGTLYLAGDGAVYAYNPGGPGGVTTAALLRVPRAIETTNITDVAVDDAGQVYAVMQSGRMVGWTAANAYRDDLPVTGARRIAVGPAGGAVITAVGGGFVGIANVVNRNDFDTPPQTWGANNDTLGEVDTPRRVSTGAGNLVYILDRRERVQSWSPAGQPQQQWAHNGYAVDVAGGGALPCHAFGNSLTCRMPNPGGDWSFSLPNTGWLTAADGDADRLVALDLADQKVWLFDRAGSPQGSWPLSTDGSSYIAIADIAIEGDKVYLADQAQGRIDVRNLDGSPAGEIAVNASPLRLDVAGGRAYVLARDGRIWKYNLSGQLLTVWEPMRDGTPNDLTADSNGRIYVPDPPGDRVLVFAPDGTPPSSVPPTVDERCQVEVGKTAAPVSLPQHDPVTIQLRVAGACPLGDGRLDVALVIDESGSMTGAPMAAAQSAALAFVNELNPKGAQVAVVAFDTTATVLQPLTADLRAVVRAIARLDPGGQTNYIDALDKASAELAGPAARSNVPQVAVMMTDGKPTNRPGVEEAADRIKAVPATLYTIGLGLTVNQDLLREMASRPEFFFSAPSEAELADVYRAIARRITAVRVINLATVTDVLPADMEYEVGSAFPPPSTWTPATRTLIWQLTDVPSSGLTMSYRAFARMSGLRNTNVRADINFVDASGEPGNAVFPVPQVLVQAKTRWEAYLPYLTRNQCKPQRIDVILAFDTSGSMQEPSGDGSGGTKLEAAIAAGRTFLANMTLPGDQAAIVTFNQSARVVEGLTGSRGALIQALNRITTAPGTRIDLGIESSVSELLGPRRNPSNNPVIVLMTDGRPTSGTEGEVIKDAATARGLGFNIFTIGLGPDTDRILLSVVAGRNDRAYFAPNGALLGEIYKQVAGKAVCE